MQNFIWNTDQGDGSYTNPVLYTDYSDPDVIRVGSDYYMTASSFCNTPALPILHSKDLVNWELISYCLEQIDEPGYDLPRHGCGIWAPAIRYHNGLFYVCYPMPDEGIFMTTAKDPHGPWSKPVNLRPGKGWIDPCPFWDDDGKAYLVNGFAKSRIGFKSILHISPMNEEGTALLSEGQHVFDGHHTQPTIEGPKLYKRNGYYYIFAPAGSVKSGWQTVLRSKNIYGPYEEHIALMQSGTPVNGPHQGAWIDTPDGTDWFIHFQDVGNAGRIVHLQPMEWQNDWPVIGKDEQEGFGTPVPAWKKPVDVSDWKRQSPPDSDDFTNGHPGLQWQWNANHKASWLLSSDKGIRMAAQAFDLPLCDCPNLLLQKWTAPEFSAEFTLEFSELRDGDLAGIVSLGNFYTALTLKKENGQVRWTAIRGNIGGEEEYEDYGYLGGTATRIIYQVYADGTGAFFVPDLCDRLVPAGPSFTFTPGRWVGVKYGPFALHHGNGQAGSLTVHSVLVRPGVLTGCEKN